MKIISRLLQMWNIAHLHNVPQSVQSTQIPTVEYVTLERFNALAAKYDAIAAELEALKNKPCGCRKKKEDTDSE